MKTRFAALAVVLTLVLPGSASALETNELVALAAMPLAVAAVADLNDVPANDLITVVSALNRAAVPPPQFIEVVRYVPVALVDRREPTFVSYVTTRVDDGLTGDTLAVALADRLETSYGLHEIDVVSPPAVYVVERQLIPVEVTTRLQPAAFDPLALVAMPLAVAAVAELTDVPANDLIRFIAALNQAAVPAPQFVEVVRYSPAVFVDPTIEPRFLSFVTSEVERGTRGDALALLIADRLRSAGVSEIDVVAPRQVVFVDRTEVIPAAVRTRVATVRNHPHGGPPGQLKKERGLQTGAEVVHRDRGENRGERKVARRTPPRQRIRIEEAKPKAMPQPQMSSAPDRGQPQRVDKPRGEGRGQSKGHGNDGKGKAKGNGKGKGKD